MSGKQFFVSFFLLLIGCTIVRAQFVTDTASGAEKNTVFSSKTLPDSVVQSLKNDPDYWYADANLPEKKQKDASQSTWFDSKIFKTLVWLLVLAGFLLILLLYLRVSNFRLFAKPGTLLHSDDEAAAADDLFSIDYSREIHGAVSSGDYRYAIRLLFLQTLKQMHENGIIHYEPQATNADYIRQIREKPRYGGFHELATVFNYTWYGKFSVSPERFEQIQNRFVSFQNRLRP